MLRVLAAAILLAATPFAVQAQTYPSKPIKVLVGYPPGGAVDYTARLISERLGVALGQPIVVENRPGAGGQIAADLVSKSDPDGYTLIYAVGSDLAGAKLLTKKKTVDPLTELTPIATAISSISAVVVNAASPHKTFKDLVAFAKANPDKMSYGSVGVQSYQYLIGEALRGHGVSMLHVPYKGTGPIINAMLTGELDVALITMGVAAPQAAAGKVRMIAVFGPDRYVGTPDLPSIKEELPGLTAPQSWFGFFGPPNLPQPIVEKLNEGIAAVVKDKEMTDKIIAQNLDPMTMPANRIRPFLVEGTARFAEFVKAAKIEPVDD